MLKRIALYICDVIVIGLAALGAFFVRENFEVSRDELVSIAPYVATTILVGASSLALFRLHRGVWRLSTLSDYLRICALSVFIVVLSMTIGFLGNRLQNVARALPVIQVVFSMFGLVGARVMARLLFAWGHAKTSDAMARPNFERTRTVLLVGLNRLTMLYVRSIEDLAKSKLRIAGIVVDQRNMHGRALGTYPVLGGTKDLSHIVGDLAVHGVFVTHVCIMTMRSELSEEQFDNLSKAAEIHNIQIEFFLDTLTGVSVGAPDPVDPSEHSVASQHARANAQFWLYARRPYWKLKRALDVVVSMSLICLLAPIFVLVGLLVAVDVGLPVIFWQERPGARGRPFRIYKFRSMRGAFERDGSKRPDEERVSAIGYALRRSRLDELPQLFNVLIGEMSFVGPRPLLPVDQFSVLDARLAIAPGITGWAQVNGGRRVPADDKAALDLWYLKSASLRVDVKIVLATLRTMLKGESANQEAINRAWASLQARNLSK